MMSYWRGFLIVVALGALLWVYAHFNPERYFFPRCPFLMLTGLKCPGCGSQRAIYQLLNGNIRESLAMHPLLLPVIPYLLFGFLLEYTALGERWFALRRRLYGRVAVKIVFVVVVSFAVLRNIFGF